VHDVRLVRTYDAWQADLFPHKTPRRRRRPSRQDDDVLPPHGCGVELEVALLTGNDRLHPDLWQVGDQLIDIPADTTTKGRHRGGIDEDADQRTPALLNLREATQQVTREC
jgi:hypothetical protein